MKCLTEEELLAAIDGGIPPNARASLDNHLAGCKTCQTSLAELEALVGDLATLPELDEDAHVKGVMDRLDEQRRVVPMPTSTRARSRWLMLGGAVAATLVAAAVLLIVQNDAQRRADSTFAARGGPTERTMARDVGVRVLTGKQELAPLASGATVAAAASFTGAYTNVHDKPVYLLLFAVDAEGAVHWLYPAYVSASENPASVTLGRAPNEVAMETSIVLDKPAAGPLRFVSLLTEAPLHVHDIEDRRADALATDALQRAFPQANVTDLVVQVTR